MRLRTIRSGGGGRPLQWIRLACRFGIGALLRRHRRGLHERAGQSWLRVAGKGQVGVGFGASQAVVQVGGVEDQTEFGGCDHEGAQEGDGVCAAGEADGEAQAGLEESAFPPPEEERCVRAGILRMLLFGQIGHVSSARAGSGVEEKMMADGNRKLKSKELMLADVYSSNYAGICNSSGRRTGHPDGRAQPKQFLALDGVPILIHSLRAFAAVERVTVIYVAVRKTETERVEAQIAEYGFAGRAHVVEGGDNRQESVSHALAALPAEPNDIVLVHDAVRPLIDVATIDRTIDAVAEYGAAIVGLPAVDTIKQVERTAHGALITSTIPREYMVLAQTPQGFRYELLMRAFAEATADGFVGTDEASLVERAGNPVAVVHGSQVNLKITQPGDLELAEFYLHQRNR